MQYQNPMLLTLVDSKFSNLNLIPKDPQKPMLAQMSVRILNKEQLGEQSYIIIYTEAIASIIIFLILIGILIYNFYKG